MGYPMTYLRVVNRNGLTGDYNSDDGTVRRGLIAGDMRRLENDTMDEWHIAAYAEFTGLDPADIHNLFLLFFEGPGQSVANRAVVLEWEVRTGRKHPTSEPS